MSQPGTTDQQQAATEGLLKVLDWYTLSDIAPTLTCIEANALAEFLTAHGHDESATVLLDAHAEADDEGDEHFTPAELAV
jgi:hypothetical protein